MVIGITAPENLPYNNPGTMFEAPDEPVLTAVDAEDEEVPDEVPAGLKVDRPADDEIDED